MTGPLAGIRIVELAGIGPAPFCGMVLADHGAEVVAIDRPVPGALPMPDLARRGKRSIIIDLKSSEGVDLALRLVATADALIEGFRPGVAERLGLGPDDCWNVNRRLVYGRMTGWGQTGPLAAVAGHDIDYIALSGVLDAIGPVERPVPPLNLVGDYGGGGLLLAFGVLAGLLEARQTGEGRIVDAAMVDGSALLMTPVFELAAAGMWPNPRGGNLLDGGAPFYAIYETADRRFMAVGALEPAFYAVFLALLGLSSDGLPDQYDPSGWPTLRRLIAGKFAERTRTEWAEVFEGSDACVAPVLSRHELAEHPHNAARELFYESAGSVIPGVAPRFSGYDRRAPEPGPTPGSHTDQLLAELGVGAEDRSRLRAAGTIR